MNALRSIDELCARISAAAPETVVGIEGFCGSGKSMLANKLGKRGRMSVVHMDDYATKFDEPPPYPECVDIVRLRSALVTRDPLRASVVEGICLRDVLALVGIAPRLLVYVKRIAGSGLWHDKFHLEDFEAGQPDAGDIEEPHLSDFRYHQRSRPHERADLIYERVEDDCEDCS